VTAEAAIVNAHEAAAIFGQSTDAWGRLAPDERAGLVAERGLRQLVITRGAEPTLHVAPDGALTAVPTLAVRPRDTVGAGDTFAGALAAELARGAGWPEALRRANVAAALATLALGAQAAMPTRAAVDAALAGNAAPGGKQR